MHEYAIVGALIDLSWSFVNPIGLRQIGSSHDETSLYCLGVFDSFA